MIPCITSSILILLFRAVLPKVIDSIGIKYPYFTAFISCALKALISNMQLLLFYPLENIVFFMYLLNHNFVLISIKRNYAI